MPYVTCPECDREVKAPRELIGLEWNCPKCGESFVVEEDSGGSAVESVIRDRRRKRESNLTGPLIIVGSLVALTVCVVIIALVIHRSRKDEQARAERDRLQQKTERPVDRQPDRQLADRPQPRPDWRPSEPVEPPAERAQEQRRTQASDDREAHRDYSVSDVVIGIPVFLFCAAIYFAPSIVAICRGHANLAPILVVNIFFGCLLVGWVVALSWAVSYQSRVGPKRRYTAE